jgi:hypothetical protein
MQAALNIGPHEAAGHAISFGPPQMFREQAAHPMHPVPGRRSIHARSVEGDAVISSREAEEGPKKCIIDALEDA